jgi:hypothetical protein
VPDDSLRAGIRLHIESEGLTYAGLCREIEQWQHYGETCAFVLAIDGDQAHISYGLVASDEIGRATLLLEDGEWFSEGQSEPVPSPASGSGPTLPTGPGHEDEFVPPVHNVPADLEAAIREFLEQRGLTYAGLCAEIVQHEHYGKTCAFVTQLEDGQATVTYGRVASDELNSIDFSFGESGWYADASPPIVPPATPTTVSPTPIPSPSPLPRPSDVVDDSGNMAVFVVAGIAGSVIVGGAGAYGYNRRRSS